MNLSAPFRNVEVGLVIMIIYRLVLYVTREQQLRCCDLKTPIEVVLYPLSPKSHRHERLTKITVSTPTVSSNVNPVTSIIQ